MKIFKKILIATAGAATLVMPSLAMHAMAFSCDSIETKCDLTPITVPLDCNGVDGEFPFQTTEGCDLAVDKQVSVNGGAFVEADTSADAAQAQVGDTVTWQITVTNNSDQGLTPEGTLTVSDVLPSGTAFDSYTASAGTYDGTSWTLDLSDNLPATLTITSHAVSTGLFKNTATLSGLESCNSDGCTSGIYTDSDPDNNSNDAWIDPSGKPVVLGESTTLPNTGSGVGASLVAGGLIAATAVVSLAGRRNLAYKFNR